MTHCLSQQPLRKAPVSSLYVLEVQVQAFAHAGDCADQLNSEQNDLNWTEVLIELCWTNAYSLIIYRAIAFFLHYYNNCGLEQTQTSMTHDSWLFDSISGESLKTQAAFKNPAVKVKQVAAAKLFQVAWVCLVWP